MGHLNRGREFLDLLSKHIAEVGIYQFHLFDQPLTFFFQLIDLTSQFTQLFLLLCVGGWRI